MKKSLFVIFLLIMSSFAFSAIPDDVAVKLSLINQNPDPVSPGEYVTVKIRAENLGNEAATSFKTTLVESYPFSLDPGKSPVKEIGVLGKLQDEEDSQVIEYDLRVARDALEGNIPLEIFYEFEGSATQKTELMIEIKTQDSGLSIDSVSSEALEQGKKGYVEIRVNNPSDSTLRDVTLSLDLSSEDLPIAPIESSASKTVQTLNAGGESIFRFGLMPFPDAGAQVYKVPVEITFYNSLNELVTKMETIGLIVGTEPDVSMYTESETFFESSQKGVVTVDFVNKGLIDIKFLDVILEDTEDYEVVSSNEVYIGSVDSDDFESADFTIMRLSEKNPFDVKLKVEYKDFNNVDYEQELSLPVKLFPEEKEGNFPFVLVAILLVVVGFFLYRHIKKKKKR